MPQIFPFLDQAEEALLLSTCPIETFSTGAVIIEQSVPLAAIYILEDGEVRVERQDHATRSCHWHCLAAPEFFGEVSFIDGEPTSARVIAERPSQIRVVNTEVVKHLAAQFDGFEARFYRSIAAILARRLRQREFRAYSDPISA